MPTAQPHGEKRTWPCVGYDMKLVSVQALRPKLCFIFGMKVGPDSILRGPLKNASAQNE